ncbi:hypothetical protein F2Q70_00032906 [Brassica cretica]|uniref:Uncharacterized protein n=1 Tax=Brassica cretica TaxID=69181 RepID=A0A8S9FNL0_BRACR|nr:hypothetical protein F2Q70_00032906 [Brassica cretica]
MFRLHFAYMSLYQVIIGRAEDGSEVPQRRHEVAPKHLSERPSWSDPVKSLAIFIPLEAQSDLPRATHRGRSHLTPLSERPPKATPRGRSRLYGETTRSEARSDLSERPTEVAPEGRSDLSERHAESIHNASSELATQKLINRHFPPKRCLMKCLRQLS